jgi:hypothetical protein
MAWSLIFGLLMSLVLTLVVVPSFYKLLTRRGSRRLAERVDAPAVSPACNQGLASGAGTSRESVG